MKSDFLIIRLNTGSSYGVGHLMRCLIIAQSLKKCFKKVIFLIKTDNQKSTLNILSENLNETDYMCKFLSQKLTQNDELYIILDYYLNFKNNFLILDHYQISLSYQLFLKKNKVKWLQFDYRVSGKYFANILINLNLDVTKKDYYKKISNDTFLALGPKYLPLKEFQSTKQRHKNSILISLGGGNYPKKLIDFVEFIVKHNQTNKFKIITNCPITLNQLKNYDNLKCFKYHKDPERLYSISRLAIVAGGMTSYEIAYLRIPMILIPYANNQIKNARSFHKHSLGYNLKNVENAIGFFKKNNIENIIVELNKIKKYEQPLIDLMGSKRIKNLILNELQ